MRRLLLPGILAAGLLLLGGMGCNTVPVDRTLFDDAAMRAIERGIAVDLAGEIGSGFAGGGAAAACGT